jgi:hypothetical protein
MSLMLEAKGPESEKGSRRRKRGEIMDIFKVTTGIADDIMNLANWAYRRLETPSNSVKRSDALGCEAEVSIGLKPGRTGEIILVQNNQLQHYPAKCVKHDAEFRRGARVKIVGVGTNMMHVDVLDSPVQHYLPEIEVDDQ